MQWIAEYRKSDFPYNAFSQSNTHAAHRHTHVQKANKKGCRARFDTLSFDSILLPNKEGTHVAGPTYPANLGSITRSASLKG